MQAPRRRAVSQAHKTKRYREALLRSLVDFPDGIAVHQSRWDVAVSLTAEGKGRLGKPYGPGGVWRKFSLHGEEVKSSVPDTDSQPPKPEDNLPALHPDAE